MEREYINKLVVRVSKIEGELALMRHLVIPHTPHASVMHIEEMDVFGDLPDEVAYPDEEEVQRAIDLDYINSPQ